MPSDTGSDRGGASGKNMTRAYIGIGSNLQQPMQQVRKALTALAELHDSQLLAHSRLYRSAPLGGMQQPDYINAVAVIETSLSAMQLLQALHVIEQAQGRQRDGTRWAARTLDLDILLFGDQSLRQPGLQVPHPGLHERNFVLYPLQEIAPGLEIPGLGELSALLAQCPATGLEPVDTV
jgi:2-amino-4-hydroxy-6-hydroxymethyldihydropteridine diphosphokinase